MPKISNKGFNMPESPIRKLVPFAENAKRKGKKVYHLNIGQPDIQTPSVALEAIKNFDNNVVEYSHSAGFESYRKGLASYYQSLDIDVSYNDLMVTTGGSEALLFALNSCLDAGDEIIIPEPFYANYNGFSISAGITVKPISTSISNGFALPPIEDFVKLITPKTKAILICNPGNPTGYLYSQKELELLRDVVKKYNLFLFADEVYREFCYDGNSHCSVLSLDGLEKHAVVIDSTSKRYSLCGARIGFIVSKNSDFIQTCLKFALTRLSPPTLALIAADKALNCNENYIKGAINEYSNRRKVLISELSKLSNIKYSDPIGAFYSIIKLPIKDAEKFSKFLLTDFSINNESVMLAPASGFYSSKNNGDDEVRIAFVLNSEKLKRAINIIDKGLKEYIS